LLLKNKYNINDKKYINTLCKKTINRKLYYNIKKIDLVKVIYKKIVKIYKSKKSNILIKLLLSLKS